MSVGGAGLIACETLRQEGYTGKILLATSEKYLPYDRPLLSKGMNKKPQDIQLRPNTFYQVKHPYCSKKVEI